MRKTNRVLTVVALLFGLFLTAMEMTVVSTAMPTAVGELGGLPLYAWAFTAYMLTTTVTLPIYGKLADLYGRKPILMLGIALFLGGSFACGHADSMAMLIAFRAFQGLGAGAIQPVTLTIVGDLFEARERGRMQGLFGAVWGLAGLVGPLLGGFMVHTLSWRWVFYINVPFGLGCAAVLAFSYHEEPERRPHRIDVGGALLLTAAITAALLATRSRASVMLALPAAVVFGIGFVMLERCVREPLLPLDLFGQRVIAVASATGALVGAAMISMVTFVPLWVQSVLGGSPTAAGSAIAPMAVGWPIASALAGRLLPRTGYRPLICSGLALTALAGLGMALGLRSSTPLWVPQVLTFVYGAGLGLANTPLIIAIQASVPWNRRGIATASTMFFRTIGGTLAVGILGGILANALSDGGVSPAVAEQLLGPDRSLLPAAVIASLAGTLQEAMGIVFWTVAAVAAAAFATGWAFPPLQATAAGSRPADANRPPASP
jgi:EmrB/QacA subfamily drug resistance transporter